MIACLTPEQLYAKRIKDYIRAGKGKGTGVSYKSWLTVRTKGLNSSTWRPYGKNGRVYHLLSGVEMGVFCLLEMSRVVTDIREQFPLLPLENTQRIASDLGCSHPRACPFRDKRLSKVDVVMSSDFLVYLADLPDLPPNVVISVKRAGDLEQTTSRKLANLLNKAEIERRYWAECGVPFLLVTEEDVPEVLRPGSRWNDFCKVLWTYQYTTEKTDMTPEHAAALFDVSQGITELLVIAYKNAQIRAISTNRPFVTPAIIRSVRDTLNLAQPALGALRRGSAFVIDRMSDLKAPAGVETQPFLRADPVASDLVTASMVVTGSTDSPKIDAMMANNLEEESSLVEARSSSDFGGRDHNDYQSDRTAERPLAKDEGSRMAAADIPVAEIASAASLNSAGCGNADYRADAGALTPFATSLLAVASGHAPTLLQVVQDGTSKGLGPRESLASIGCGAGDLFWRMTQLPR